MKEPTQHRNALHYLRIVETGSLEYARHIKRSDRRELGRKGYVMWAAFFEGMRECKFGRRVNNPEELMKAVWQHQGADAPPELTELANEIFFVDLEVKRVFIFRG